MPNPLKLKLEPIGAAIRLVSNDTDTPMSPRFDDAFLEPESPWQPHSFLQRLRLSSGSSKRKSRRRSCPDEQEYIKQLEEFHNKRHNVSAPIAEDPITDHNKNYNTNRKSTVSIAGSLHSVPGTPAPSQPPPPTPTVPELPEHIEDGGSATTMIPDRPRHVSSNSLSTVNSQTPSVSSSILFPPALDTSSCDSSFSASPRMLHTSLSEYQLVSGGNKLPVSKVERLQSEIDQLKKEAAVLTREVDLLDRILQDPYSYSREYRVRTQRQRDETAKHLDGVLKRKYELGMKLTRAWNRQRDTSGYTSRFFSNGL